MTVPWPGAAIRELRLQVVHPGQVVQHGGQVVSPQEPRWEIGTTFWPDDRDVVRTWLNSLGNALEDTRLPIDQLDLPTPLATPANRTQTVTATRLNDRGSQVQLTISAASASAAGIAAGQFWTVGTATDQRLFEVVGVAGASVQVVPGRLPVSGTDRMVLAASVRVRLADPGAAVWGAYDAGLDRHLGPTLTWVEV